MNTAPVFLSRCAIIAAVLPAAFAGHASASEVAARSFCDVLSSAPPASLRPGSNESLVPPDWTIGAKKLLFYRVGFTDNTKEPVSTETAETALAEANEILKNVSFGLFSIEWTITPLLQLPKSTDDYADVVGRTALLDDARAAAKAAGFDHEQYALDMVRHHTVPGFLGGYGNLGGKGAWIQTDEVYVIVHELGHNLGLSHANYWNTTGPSSSPKISPPFPTGTNEGRGGHEFDPDSWLGHDTIIGLGKPVEYGDIFDIMGLSFSSRQFNAVYKHQLGWLAETNVISVKANGTFRLFAFDTSLPLPERSYGLRIDNPAVVEVSGRRYWVQLRSGRDSAGQQRAVQIHWGDGERQTGSSLLLDMTPGSNMSEQDSALVIGRTFSDRLANLHITPMARNETGDDDWIDVVVQIGPFPTNQPPAVALISDAAQVGLDTPVRFSAVASDSNGDDLASAWDFGDGTFGPDASHVEKSWRREGEFVVRCDVSDMKSGVASKHLVIRVGTPKTFQISGRVFDENGQPVQGVRVHNGKLLNPEEGTPYVWNFTDSDGAYTLSNLRAGSYTNGAFLFGYTTRPAGSEGPVVLTNKSVTNVDFVATLWPRLIVSVKTQTLKEGEGTEFVFTRTGPTNAPATVAFTASGTAQARSDYPDFFLRRVTIPAGAASANLSLNTFADSEAEGEETVTLRAELATESHRTRLEPDGSTNQFTVFYPGWELRPRNGQLYWFQTDPEYLVTSESSAAVTIQDGSAAPQYEVSVIASDLAAIETPKFDGSFTLTRQGSLSEALTVFFRLAGTANNSVDYETIQDSATIPAGQDFVNVPVVPIPDLEPEGTESVLVTLLPNGHYTISSGETTVFIKDNDRLPTSLAVKRQPDGSLAIHLTAQAGKRYVLQESPDLVRWTPTQTNLLFASPLIFKLPAAPGTAERFYRTTVQ